MPLAVDPSDRKLLLIAGAILLTLTIALAILAPPNAQQMSQMPSVYSAASGGARAAYLLIKQLGYSVTVWDRPPAGLPEDPEGAVLIIVNPSESPSEKERAALMQFAVAGGRIVFTGPEINSFFSDANVSEEPYESEWRGYDAKIPSPFTADAPRIELQPEAEWITIGPLQLELYGDQDSATVVSWSVGKAGGEILWWAAATPLTNAGITHESNLNLFLDAVSFAANTPRKPAIYWDEYFHGERASLWASVGNTPVAWGLLQVAILGLAVLFTFSRRSGPIALPAKISRLWPLEFVDTLGGLYQRAHAEPALVGAVYQRFRTILTRQLRLPAGTTDDSLADAVRARLGWKDDTLREKMARAAVASRAGKLPVEDALAIIRDLENLEEQLGLKPKKI
jgi:Domain of unknown function (DUF4350)